TLHQPAEVERPAYNFQYSRKPGWPRLPRNPSINPCFWMERSVGTLNWFTTMLGWQLNQTAPVPIKNIEVDPNKSKRGQESHFAHRLASRGLGFLDRWCSWRASARDERNPPPT